MSLALHTAQALCLSCPFEDNPSLHLSGFLHPSGLARVPAHRLQSLKVDHLVVVGSGQRGIGVSILWIRSDRVLVVRYLSRRRSCPADNKNTLMTSLIIVRINFQALFVIADGLICISSIIS